VSFMRSFPNYIPLSALAVERIVRLAMALTGIPPRLLA
jgi:hypothetical protein